MKTKLIIILIVIATTVRAQLGLGTHDTLLWQAYTYVGYPHIGGVYMYDNTFHNYLIKGDSTIAGLNYKKLYAYSSSTPPYYDTLMVFNALIMEDSCCVYKGSIGNMTKILDYNLNVGDSFLFNGYNSKIKLLSIDSVFIEGAFRKRFNFGNNITWAKGVGDIYYGAHFDSYYFFNPYPISGPIWGGAFRCYAEKYVGEYGNYCVLPTGISMFYKNKNINIYPNPASTSINLTISQFDHASTNSIEILNMMGECVHRQIVKLATCQIDVSDLDAGVYFVTITSGTTISTKKVIVSK